MNRLAGVAPHQEWASRYSNPNHPARQGGTLAVLTGGKYNPKGPVRNMMDKRKERREGEQGIEENVSGDEREHDDPYEHDTLAPVSDNSMEKVPSNLSSDGTDRDEIAWQASRKRRQGPMRRLLRQDVLYLMVVNLPTEAEMEDVRRSLEAQRPA